MESYYLHKLNKYKSKLFDAGSGKEMKGGKPHLIEDVGLLYLLDRYRSKKEKHERDVPTSKNKSTVSKDKSTASRR